MAKVCLTCRTQCYGFYRSPPDETRAVHAQYVNVIRKPSGTAHQTVGGCSIEPPAMEVWVV